jgi:hypothetical protein
MLHDDDVDGLCLTSASPSGGVCHVGVGQDDLFFPRQQSE